jgi:hypothetical protein
MEDPEIEMSKSPNNELSEKVREFQQQIEAILGSIDNEKVS